MCKKNITILNDPIPIGRERIPEAMRIFLRMIRNYFYTPTLNFNKSKFRGHPQVTRSLFDGLKDNKFDFNYNPRKLKLLNKNVIILSNIRAVKQAIRLKKKGLIENLLVGPNILTHPIEEEELMTSRYIDRIIVPSEWIKVKYIALCPSLKDRCFVWPSGVNTNYWNEVTKEKNTILVYIKEISDNLKGINIDLYINYLRKTNCQIEVVRYGYYKHSDLRELLQKSILVVGFSDTESQGIVWSECWSCNVPTLVLRVDYFDYKGHKFGASSAPYLNEKNGLFFEDFENFKDKITYILSNLKLFTPRKLVKSQMSDSVSAKLIIDLFNVGFEKKIGIILSSTAINTGSYYYSISALNALRDYSDNSYVLFHTDENNLSYHEYEQKKWTLVPSPEKDGHWVKIFRLFDLLGFSFFRALAAGKHSKMKKYDLDYTICLTTSLASYWCNMPYVTTIHDTHSHFSDEAFFRSIFYKKIRYLQWKKSAKNAKKIVAESELGRDSISEIYGVDKARIKINLTGVAPFMWNKEKGDNQDIERLKPYLFYPGPHQVAKNQIRIIEAVSILKHEHNININVVLAGPINSYTNELNLEAKKLKVSELVHTIGFINNQDMLSWYSNAFSMVMPSYIGPTNMPIYEAFVAGCPVISSNSGEMVSQVGEAGIIFDPDNKYALVSSILSLYDQKLRNELIKKGNCRVEMLKPEIWGVEYVNNIID